MQKQKTTRKPPLTATRTERPHARPGGNRALSKAKGAMEAGHLQLPVPPVAKTHLRQQHGGRASARTESTRSKQCNKNPTHSRRHASNIVHAHISQVKKEESARLMRSSAPGNLAQLVLWSFVHRLTHKLPGVALHGARGNECLVQLRRLSRGYLTPHTRNATWTAHKKTRHRWVGRETE